MATTKELFEQILSRLETLEGQRVLPDAHPDDPEAAEAQRALREAVLSQAVDEAEAEAARNAPVLFAVSVLMSWDGDPDVEGAENYAPEGWNADAWRAENGLPPDHAAPVIAGNSFTCARLTAEGLAKAGLGQIAT